MTKDVIIYRNELHEEAVRQEIAWCLEEIKKLVTVWDALKVTKLTDTGMMYDLIFDTENRLSMEVARRSYASGDKIDRSRLNTGPLLAVASKVRQYAVASKGSAVFEFNDGSVTVNEAAAEELIGIQRIYARTPAQVEFYENLRQFEVLFNTLDAQTNGAFLRDRNERAQWMLIFDIAPGAKAGAARINPRRIEQWLREVYY